MNFNVICSIHVRNLLNWIVYRVSVFDSDLPEKKYVNPLVTENKKFRKFYFFIEIPILVGLKIAVFVQVSSRFGTKENFLTRNITSGYLNLYRVTLVLLELIYNTLFFVLLYELGRTGRIVYIKT